MVGMIYQNPFFMWLTVCTQTLAFSTTLAIQSFKKIITSEIDTAHPNKVLFTTMTNYKIKDLPLLTEHIKALKIELFTKSILLTQVSRYCQCITIKLNT